MNFLVANIGDVTHDKSQGRIIISQARSETILFEEDNLKVGDERKLCLVNCARYMVAVEEVSSTITLKVIREDERLPDKLNLTAIIGLSRPQTIKKCIHMATTLGIKKIVLVSGELGERSYLKSKILTESELNDELIKAIAQSGDPIAPQIQVIEKFWQLWKEELQGEHKYVFHTGEGEGPPFLGKVLGATCIAIGSEAGWSEAELGKFIENGFKQCMLGPRILRVETALAAVIGRML